MEGSVLVSCHCHLLPNGCPSKQIQSNAMHPFKKMYQYSYNLRMIRKHVYHPWALAFPPWNHQHCIQSVFANCQRTARLHSRCQKILMKKAGLAAPHTLHRIFRQVIWKSDYTLDKYPCKGKHSMLGVLWKTYSRKGRGGSQGKQWLTWQEKIWS